MMEMTTVEKCLSVLLVEDDDVACRDIMNLTI